LFKIGLSRVGVDRRLKELSSPASVPTPFEVQGVIASDHCGQLEKFLHRCLSRRRVSSVREFFAFDCANEAIDLFESHSELFAPKPYTRKQERKLSTKPLVPVTPSEQAKAYNCKSVKQVSRAVVVPVRTLYDWFKYRPELYQAVCEWTANRETGE